MKLCIVAVSGLDYKYRDHRVWLLVEFH